MRPQAQPRRSALPVVTVAALAGHRWRGRLIAGTWTVPCVLGPAGIKRDKREGDGATPAGRFRFERVLYRGDRVARPASALPGKPLRSDQGWCDDQASACYNRPVVLPFGRGHERLWREDRLYDLLIVIDHNRAPTRKARGSAIFMHVKRVPDGSTAGCVALDPQALRTLITRIDRNTRLSIV